MTLATCPHCAFQGEIEAFFVDDDGKRLAAVVAELPAECGRAVLAYLRLFKPPKTGLRTARAVKLAREVVALVAAGTVCKDERSGVRRPALPSMWAQGIEQMLAQRDRLSLPLESHGYLRAVVYGLADSVDAAAERQREADARVGKHLREGSEKSVSAPVESKLQNALAYIAQQVHVGTMSQEQAETERAKAREKYGRTT
ncbi:MAG TPA: hypothetical protein VGE33_11960 [Thermomonas sp.]